MSATVHVRVLFVFFCFAMLNEVFIFCYDITKKGMLTLIIENELSLHGEIFKHAGVK